MAAPSPPYCTSGQVAAFAQSRLLGKVDFDAQSTPTKKTVEDAIGLVSGQIDMTFRNAGYKVPFVELSGESWPSDQTTYLQFLAAIGTSALAIGHASNPAPALGPGFTPRSGNVYQDLFYKELAIIWTPGRRPGEGVSSIRFRAQYYNGSPVEWLLREPRAPTTDFLENKHDPMATLDSRSAANSVIRLWRGIAQINPRINYLRGLFDINAGLSTEFGNIFHIGP